jgi:hypothetical protein
MRPVQRYSLVDVDREVNRARLVRDGQPLPLLVSGVLLVEQFDLGDGSSLLWLTEDSPFEEGLHVYLLGREGELEDALEAGATFAPGILKLKATGEEWVEFEFFRDEVIYRLEVERDARLRLCVPTGWRYEKTLERHRLRVTRAFPAPRVGAQVPSRRSPSRPLVPGR